MGPSFAANSFKSLYDSQCDSYIVILYGSLAATGKGHMTDVAIENELKPKPVAFIWKPTETLLYHVNGMTIKAIKNNSEVGQETYYSVGGGAIVVDSTLPANTSSYKRTYDVVYPLSTMNAIMRWCRKTGLKLYDLVYENEDASIKDYLKSVWEAMKHCVEVGLKGKGVLPGGLNLPRKAHDMFRAAHRSNTIISVGMVIIQSFNYSIIQLFNHSIIQSFIYSIIHSTNFYEHVTDSSHQHSFAFILILSLSSVMLFSSPTHSPSPRIMPEARRSSRPLPAELAVLSRVSCTISLITSPTSRMMISWTH